MCTGCWKLVYSIPALIGLECSSILLYRCYIHQSNRLHNTLMIIARYRLVPFFVHGNQSFPTARASEAWPSRTLRNERYLAWRRTPTISNVVLLPDCSVQERLTFLVASRKRSPPSITTTADRRSRHHSLPTDGVCAARTATAQTSRGGCTHGA